MQDTKLRGVGTLLFLWGLLLFIKKVFLTVFSDSNKASLLLNLSLLLSSIDSWSQEI